MNDINDTNNINNINNIATILIPPNESKTSYWNSINIPFELRNLINKNSNKPYYLLLGDYLITINKIPTSTRSIFNKLLKYFNNSKEQKENIENMESNLDLENKVNYLNLLLQKLKEDNLFNYEKIDNVNYYNYEDNKIIFNLIYDNNNILLEYRDKDDESKSVSEIFNIFNNKDLDFLNNFIEEVYFILYFNKLKEGN